MAVQIDVSELSAQLKTLHRAPHRDGHESIAVVVPLAEGRREVVREFLAEEPPFDPHEIGLTGHEVFLTDREAVFVFEAEAGARTFERILAEEELWDVVGAWERSAAAQPRLGAAVYEWRERSGGRHGRA
jgi:hypothetical protein